MTILDQIVKAKQTEVSAAKARTSAALLQQQLRRASLAPPQDFLAALRHPPTLQVIAEIKRASPAAGVMQAAPDIEKLAREYERHGSACISVLTDGPYFRGSLNDLQAVRQSVAVPLLRKDFIIDPYQVWEARLAGADAVLLIAEILDDAALRELLREIEALSMTALVECYEPENLERVLAAGAKLVGINNRNLRTFVTDLDHTCRLASRVSDDRVLVSESGIRTRDDVQRLAACGVQAILVGETLMRSGAVDQTLASLRDVPKQSPPRP